MSEKSMIVIGAGIAGLSAGVYACLNGYRTHIFEMHTLPGGLMTAWKRKGFTVEGCIHWLTGSAPGSSLYPLWEEIGLIQDRQILDLEEFLHYESKSHGKLILYANLDRFQEHLLTLAPEDEKEIRRMIADARKLVKFDLLGPPEGNLWQGLKTLTAMAPFAPIMMRFMKMPMDKFGERFKNPLLREVFREMWGKDFSAFSFMMMLSWMHAKQAGYPVGGSLPMACAVEQRYKSLGGEITYGKRVQKILVENDRAVGVRLDDGSEHRADVVISAADGHATIFDMLEGKYVNEKIKGYYENLPIFEPLLYISLGINQDFKDQPATISGIDFPLDEPITLGDKTYERLHLHAYNYDPTFAPEGKTVAMIMLPAHYEYWKNLEETDTELYEAKKNEAGERVIAALDQRFPGMSKDVVMCDVATPVTFERYTGNWKGCFEGWLATPETMTMRMEKTLPGLENFYMVGQWVQPGGGLPSGVMTARQVMQTICKKEKATFRTAVSQ